MLDNRTYTVSMLPGSTVTKKLKKDLTYIFGETYKDIAHLYADNDVANPISDKSTLMNALQKAGEDDLFVVISDTDEKNKTIGGLRLEYQGRTEDASHVFHAIYMGILKSIEI